MRHRLFVVLLILAAAVAVPGTACACSCAELTPTEQVGTATAAFTGTVVSARRAPGGSSGPPPPVVYRFRTDQVYKGAPAAEFEVVSNADGAACGYAFTIGSRYLVLASDKVSNLVGGDPGVALTTSLCAGNRPVLPGDRPLRREDVSGDDEALSGELLSALGTATPPPASQDSPVVTPAASPVAGAPGGTGTEIPWVPIGVTVGIAAAVLTGWRLLGRRRARDGG
ncbi:hypothetical protein [Planobispora rosea]|uniref:hypothetical protein n=1 Tax=Planobispora rosea TaxID=35762 RepID=UPI00083B669A|nr:hypothetical protein [Planobispora rosea]